MNADELYGYLKLMFPVMGAIATLVVGFATAIVTWYINRNAKRRYKQTQNLANDKMMKELFSEFNKRYDRLNGFLLSIQDMTIEDFQGFKESKKFKINYRVNDYFNLCSEEYFWYKKGRIDEEVWQSWSIGMNYIYSHTELVRYLWNQECENEGYLSFYSKSPHDFFNNV